MNPDVGCHIERTAGCPPVRSLPGVLIPRFSLLEAADEQRTLPGKRWNGRRKSLGHPDPTSPRTTISACSCGDNRHRQEFPPRLTSRNLGSSSNYLRPPVD